MLIHTNLTEQDMREIAGESGVRFHRLIESGSRTHARKFDLILTSPSGRRVAGIDGTYRSAPWDTWGIFFAGVFRRDPSARCVGAYDSEEHFRWATGGRFDTLTPDQVHDRHKWEFYGTAVTGSYSVHRCRVCDAVQRRVEYGRHFSELEAV